MREQGGSLKLRKITESDMHNILTVSTVTLWSIFSEMLRSFTLSAFRIPSSTSSSCFPSTSSSSHLPLGVDLRRLLRNRIRIPSSPLRTIRTQFHSMACLNSSASSSMSVDELLEQIELKTRKIEEMKRQTRKLKRKNKEIFDQQEKEKNQLLKEGQ